MRQGSFVRKGAALAADPGTRPGLHGQTLVSSGHPHLDRLLGGGLPLGSVLLLLEDGWSGHHATLLRYFLAEGAACGQSLLLAAAAAPAGGLPKFIPAQLKGRSADKEEEEGGKEQEEFKLRIAWQYRRYIRTGQQTGSGGSSALTSSSTAADASISSSRGGGGVVSASGGSGSRSAAGGSSSSGGSSAARRPLGLRDWCHQFDLLKPLGQEGLQQCRAELVQCGSSCSINSADSATGGSGGDGFAPTSSMQQLLASATVFVQSLAPPQQAQQPGAAAATVPAVGARAPAVPLPPRGPQHVGRIAVLSLGSLAWQLAEQGPANMSSSGSSSSGSSIGGAAVVRALLQLKALVRDQRCVAVASVPAALYSPSDVARMQHIADGVLALESVADGSDIVRLAPDPASVAGLLHVRKLPALGTLAPPTPEVALHLIRHKRRRVAITPVEIDPDAEMADAEAASGTGKSVASVLCGGPAGASKAVDF